MDPLKLFAVYLGGRAERCNIELHDLVFVVSTSIEDAHPKLVRKWFGTTNRLHVDSHIELAYVDGFAISLLPITDVGPPGEDDDKLYFINFGAYDTRILGEVHQSGFYVAKRKMDAVAKAKKELCRGLFQIHCDDSLDVNNLMNEHGEGDVDDILEISEVDTYRIRLTPTDKVQAFQTICGYRKINVDGSP